MGLNDDYEILIDQVKLESQPLINNSNNNNKNNSNNSTINVYSPIYEIKIERESAITSNNKFNGFSNKLPPPLSHLFSPNEFKSIIDKINSHYQPVDAISKSIKRLLILVLVFFVLGVGIMVLLMLVPDRPALTITLPVVLTVSFLVLIFSIVRSLIKGCKVPEDSVHKEILSINSKFSNRGIEFNYIEKNYHKLINEHISIKYTISEFIQNKDNNHNFNNTPQYQQPYNNNNNNQSQILNYSIDVSNLEQTK